MWRLKTATNFMSDNVQIFQLIIRGRSINFWGEGGLEYFEKKFLKHLAKASKKSLLNKLCIMHCFCLLCLSTRK